MYAEHFMSHMKKHHQTWVTVNRTESKWPIHTVEYII